MYKLLPLLLLFACSSNPKEKIVDRQHEIKAAIRKNQDSARMVGFYRRGSAVLPPQEILEKELDSSIKLKEREILLISEYDSLETELKKY